MSEEQHGRISWVQVTAAALAAVSSAFILSMLGVGGTLAGAAIGSIVASLGANMYTRGISAGHKHTVLVLKDGRLRPAGSDAQGSQIPDQVLADDVVGDLVADEVDGADESADAKSVAMEQGESGKARSLSWKRVLVSALAIFAIAMGVITVVELVAGKSFSSITGNTDQRFTVPGGGRTGNDRSPSPTPTPSNSSSPTPSDSPSPSPTPSESPSATTPSPTTPAPTTLAPTDEPTGSGTPTGTADPDPSAG